MTTGFQPTSRLPVSGPDAATRRGERVRGAFAVLGTLAVVIGVPVLLVLVVGNPLPTSLPSREWLTADISVEVVLKVVAVVVWAVWAHFVACLLVELRAARSGDGLPGAVPFGGGSQHLARKLVAAALLLAGTASLAPSGALSTAPTSTPGISAAAEDAWGSRYQAQAMQIAQQQAAAEAAATEQASDDAGAVQAEIYYTVQPPNGRHHDTLWDIAERTLGDPLRYKELYQLNHERVQPDGRTLVDADLIYPGWVMRMPADASGPGLTVVEPGRPGRTRRPVRARVPGRPGPRLPGGRRAGHRHRLGGGHLLDHRHRAGSRPRALAARRRPAAGRRPGGAHRPPRPVRRAR